MAPGGGRHRLAVVRHGATAWSRDGRHTGRTDLPLLPMGEEEARALAPRLGGDWALVLTSPLQRARRTCELAGLGDRAEVDDDLLEWDYGDLEGLTTPQIRTDRPGWTIWSGPVPGGETIDDVARRVDRVVERARREDGDVIAFAHGHVLRVLAARWCGLPPVTGKHLVLGPARPCTLGWEHEYPVVEEWNAR